MRLWSLNPILLDKTALRACWANTVLARNTMRSPSIAYAKHSPLNRFNRDIRSMLFYMDIIQNECLRRMHVYRTTDRFYDAELKRFLEDNGLSAGDAIEVSTKQLEYEYALLQSRLYWRSRRQYLRNKKFRRQNGASLCSRMFDIYEGDIEPWERPIAAIVKKMR